MPDWSSQEAPGGMTPKAYIAMLDALKGSIYFGIILSLSVNTTTIGSYVFAHCTSLALKELPPNVETIGYFAFRDCTSLALKELPPNLTSITFGAFAGCDQLLGSNFAKAVRALSPNAFG